MKKLRRAAQQPIWVSLFQGQDLFAMRILLHYPLPNGDIDLTSLAMELNVPVTRILEVTSIYTV